MADPKDELAELIESLGIDPADAAAMLEVDTSGDVLLGQMDASTAVMADRQLGWYGRGPLDGEMQIPVGPGQLRNDLNIPRQGPEKVTTIGDELKNFYGWDKKMLVATQALLYAAGYYGADANIDDIRWGVADDASFSAWSSAVATAARSFASGHKLSTHDILAEAAIAAGLDPEEIKGENWASFGPHDLTEKREGKLVEVMLSDPNGLRSSIDQVAGAVLGRRATAEEQRMFIGLIHDVQRKGQTALQTTEPTTYETKVADPYLGGNMDPATALGLDDSIPSAQDTVVEYASPDVEATAEAMLRNQNPEEAGAHDIAIQVSNLFDLLQSPVNVPSTTL